MFDLDNISSQLLYALSGYLFGIFACRYGIISTNKLKEAWAENGFSLAFLLTAIPSLLILVTAVFLFPVWMSTRTQIGAFVYLATFIFYNARARRKK